MRYFIHISFLFSLISLIFLCSSFQLPKDKEVLQERMEWFKSQQMFDSLMYYQEILVDILTQEGNVEALKLNGEKFLNTVLKTNVLAPAQKWALLQKTTVSQAWKYAYSCQLHLEASLKDSAYFYVGLLEALPEKGAALTYAYGCLAEEEAKNSENLRAALSWLQKAEKLAKTITDSACLQANQLFVYAQVGAYEKALWAGKTLLNKEKKAAYIDSVQLALLHHKLGVVYLKQQAYEPAKRYLGDAINYIGERSNLDYPVAEMWYQWATCYFNSENKPLETILYLRKVFSLFSFEKAALPSKKIYIEACNMMALQFLDVKQLDSAQVYIHAAQKAQKKLKYKLGETWAAQAKVFMASEQGGNAEKAWAYAVHYAEKDYGLKSPIRANQLLEQGKYYYQQKKYKQAKTALTEAFWALSLVSKNQTLPAANSLYSKLDAVAILTLKIENMLALYRKSKYNVSLKDIYTEAFYVVNLWREIEHIPPFFQENFLTFSTVVYEQAIEACELLYQYNQDQHYWEEAFNLAEEAKEVALQHMMKEPNAKTFGGVDSKLIQGLEQLQLQLLWGEQYSWKAQLQKDTALLEWYTKQQFALERQKKQTIALIKKQYPKYYHYQYKRSLVSLDSLQQSLQDSTILVQYLEGKRSIYQFLIDRDTLVLRKIFWRTYKPTILKYYKHFTDDKLKQHSQSGAFKDFCMTAYELYHKLVHHERLEQNKRMVVIPDGLLNYIPFGTLLTDIPLEEVHKIDFPKLAYLLKKKQIAYNYSSSLWWEGIHWSKAPINHEILGMVATYEEQEKKIKRSKALENLRASLPIQLERVAEIDSLSKYYAGDFYINRYATEYYLKNYASQYGILHLALYGAIDRKQPEYSSLVLTEDAYEEEDNFLTINEIKQLDLHASMVVLGNCQTAYGPYERGEGIVHLGRSFMYAGSPSVILSLWNQDAVAATAIMNAFYDNLKQKMDKDEALQQAKLTYLQTTQGLKAHPAYWAGFIPIGNYNAIEVSEPVVYVWWFVIPIAFLGFLGWWSMQALRQRR